MIIRNIRIVFMGTPAFAVPSLQFLFEAGYPIAGVVTAPDKLGGRGMKQLMISPVKKYAMENSLPVLQPANLKSQEFILELKALQADLQVVVAFRMLPEVIWGMPPGGSLNLHGSLLPAYRGAAPIQWAIIRGEKVTGLTTFFIQHEIDTGHIFLQREIPIVEEDDSGSLHDRMMIAGAGLVLATVDSIQAGNIKRIPQNTGKVSHAPKIHHADARIDWQKTTREVCNLIRGMSPYPGAWTLLDGIEWKIFKARAIDERKAGIPGTIRVENRSLFIQAGDGEIEILETKLAGKKKMGMADFLNGYTINEWLAT